MIKLCRNITCDELLEPFVENILNIKNKADKRSAINSILEAEENLYKYYKSQTMIYTEFRDFEYRDDDVRHELRLKILNELIDFERTEKDDDITLNTGGAKPRGMAPRAEKKIYYIIGLPASGKSGISNTIADLTGSYILDSDMAKRKLPEYYNKKGGATLVHNESDHIVFSYQDEESNKLNLYYFCVNNGYNIVVPKIGYNIDAILKFIEPLKERGYSAYLVLVDLERLKATQRAYNRFKQTSRYVPLSVIYDGYGNDPILNYYRIKQRHFDSFKGYLQISTDVDLGQNPTIIENVNIDNFTFG